MSKSNQDSSGLIANTVNFAKKMGSAGLQVLNHVAPDTVAKLNQIPEPDQIIEGQATAAKASDQKHYDGPQQMMRAHIPQVSQQLLGRHYQKVHHLTSFISPEFNDKVSDYLFDHLNDAISQLSSPDAVLKEVGAKSLTELARDPARSARIAVALSNQNKIWATAQGGVTGLMGVFGAALDVPCSIALALRGIYQTGRAYGFELNPEDQNVVEYIFKQLDLSSVAEKQALLAGIRAFSNMLKNHDMQQLQQLLGSSNRSEYLQHFLVNAEGEFKWPWLKHIPQISILAKLTPLASMGVGASYSFNLVDEATAHAQHVFSQARLYLSEHPDLDIDPLNAYEQSQLRQPRALLNGVAEQKQHLDPEVVAEAQPVAASQRAEKVEIEVEKVAEKVKTVDAVKAVDSVKLVETAKTEPKVKTAEPVKALEAAEADAVKTRQTAPAKSVATGTQENITAKVKTETAAKSTAKTVVTTETKTQPAAKAEKSVTTETAVEGAATLAASPVTKTVSKAPRARTKRTETTRSKTAETDTKSNKK